MGYKRKDFVQIPIAPMYEINPFGKIRNIKTGKIVNPWIPKNRVNDRQVFLRINTGEQKTKSFHVSGLVYLVHGIIPKTKTHSRIPVPVIVSRGNRSHYFDSIRQTAIFLKTQVEYSGNYLQEMLNGRAKEIGGWRLNYQR